MTEKPFIPYAHQSIGENEILAATKALSADSITRGQEVESFEKEFAQYCGANFAVAFSSGSAALAAAYFAADVTSADRLVTTPNTFVSSAGTAIQQGARPTFIDIDRSTGNLNIESAAEAVNLPQSRGKPILVPVHFAGIAVDMELLDSRLTNPDVIVIEDAAHAIGSSYPRGGPKVGSCSWSHMTIFSLHPAKTITTGEGGVVTTNSKEFEQKLKLYRNNGLERDPERLVNDPAPWYYEVQILSNNYNFTEFQAAIGREQLKRIDSFIEKRRELMTLYREKLSQIPHVKLFTEVFDDHTAFHLCVVQIDYNACKTNRNQVMDKLKAQGIGTQVHYIPLYRHPFFVKKYGEMQDNFPEAEAYYAQALSLPLYYDLKPEQVDDVVRALKTALGV